MTRIVALCSAYAGNRFPKYFFWRWGQVLRVKASRPNVAAKTPVSLGMRAFLPVAAFVVLGGSLVAGCTSDPKPRYSTYDYPTYDTAWQPSSDPDTRVQNTRRKVMQAATGLCGLWTTEPSIYAEQGDHHGNPTEAAAQDETHAFSLFGMINGKTEQDDAIRADTRATFGARLGSVGQCDYDVAIINRLGLNAFTDRDHISITWDLVNFAQNDAELAFVIAHEVAHNLLGHQLPRDPADRQELEIEADYVGLYLVARAGYDPEPAANLLRRMEDMLPHRISTSQTHPTFAGRYRAAQATLAEIRRKERAKSALIPDGGPIRSASLPN